MKSVVIMQIVAVLTAFTIGCSHHSHNAHHDHHAGEAKLELNDGKKWETDESLRKGMTEVKRIVTVNLQKVREGRTSAKEYSDIANQVNDQIQFLIKNCKLPADADAQLHTLIAQMIGAAHKMKGPSSISEKQKGFFEVVNAVNEYGDYFHHPQWTKVDHK